MAVKKKENHVKKLEQRIKMYEMNGNPRLALKLKGKLGALKNRKEDY